MTIDDRLERLLADVLADAAPTREPDRLVPEILRAARREHRWPRWLALIKEPPMRFSSRVAVGSPTFRLASIMALTLALVLALGAAVAVGASLLPSPAIVVAQDGTGTVKTITEAVAMAQDGDTVLVKPGTYLEGIAITEDITLRGDGDKATVIIEFSLGGPTRPQVDEPFLYGIALDGSDAHVENLTVRGPADDGSYPAVSAFVISGGAPVIDGVDIVLFGDRWDYGGPYYRRSAFQIGDGTTAVVRDSSWDGYTMMFGLANSPTFEGNVVTGQHIAVPDGGQEPVIRGNTFLEGGAIRWDAYGSGGIAEDNDITGWIGVDENNHPTIRNNRIRQPHVPDPSTGERGAAIQIASGATPVVEGNEISDSPYGIEVAGFGAKPHISGNTIRGSVSAAIIVDQGAAPTIDANVIEGNATGIEVVGTSTHPVITGNTLCENGTDLTVPGGSTLTLDGNTICQAGASNAP